MPETVPPAIEPYRLDGSAVKYLWMATIAATTLIPTRVEIDAAGTVDVTKLHVDHTGWDVGVEVSQVSMHGGGFPQTATGAKTTSGLATLVLKSDIAGVDGVSIIDEGELGYFVIMPGGDVPTRYAQVHKARCAVYTPGEGITDFQRDNFMFTRILSNYRVVIPAAA